MITILTKRKLFSNLSTDFLLILCRFSIWVDGLNVISEEKNENCIFHICEKLRDRIASESKQTVNHSTSSFIVPTLNETFNLMTDINLHNQTFISKLSGENYKLELEMEVDAIKLLNSVEWNGIAAFTMNVQWASEEHLMTIHDVFLLTLLSHLTLRLPKQWKSITLLPASAISDLTSLSSICME